MAYSYPEIKGFDGLYLQANSLSVPDGAMEKASNVVISKDRVAQKTRGFYTYFTPSSGTMNNLFLYQDRMIVVYGTKSSYLTESGSSPNEVATETAHTGATVAVTGTRRSRSMQANKNLYFTTDNGIIKLEAYNSALRKSGIPPAIDLSAQFGVDGVIAANSQTSWRIVFGRRDANGNLLLGAPSDVITLSNPASTATTIAWARSGGGPYTITVTSTGHGLIPGTDITITDFSGGGTTFNGTQTVLTTPTTSTFTFSVAADPGASGTMAWSAARKPLLEFSIPEEIDSASDGYFYEVYRTSSSTSVSAAPDPSSFVKIDEVTLTSAEVTAGVVFYDDEIDNVLLDSTKYLYTNNNTREGESQANHRAPSCQDITLFKNMAIYSNCKTRHTLDFQVIDTTVIANTDYIEVDVGAVTRRYVARTGVGNSTVRAESISGTGTVTITYTSHGFSNGDVVRLSRVTGTVPAGTYTVSGVTANTFDITSASNTATDLYFEGVTNGTYYIFQRVSSSSFSASLRDTAQGLVKAINRDPTGEVYANYISGVADIPGKIRLSAKGFGDAIQLLASSSATGGGFSPVLPTSFGTVISVNESLPNTFFAAKLGEPEAVPLVNRYPVGSINKSTLRSLALRDSLVHLKQDGVFRTTGDSPGTLSTTVIDGTIICLAPNSADVLNNEIIFLSNQGWVKVTESSVEIISRRIEDVVTPILGQTTLSDETAGIAYESDRLYLCSTLLPNETTQGETYIYNTLNNTWTTRSQLFDAAVIGTKDRLFTISSNVVMSERKNNTRIDFCGQNYSTTVNAVASDEMSATITSTGRIPVAGDVLVLSNVFSRIESVTSLGSNQYTVEFPKQTNLAASDTPVLYAQYTSEMKMAPFHGGKIGLDKHFAQLQLHGRDNSITRMFITFAGQHYGGSEETDWKASEIRSTGGWGFEPWGFFPWGLADSINVSSGTKSAPIIRTYVPLLQARNTFLQVIMQHREAGEAINLQALTFAVRAYFERVSK